MKLAPVLAGVLMVTALPVAAFAADVEHRPGFLLRLTAGGGYARTTQTPSADTDTKFHLGGPVLDTSIAIGSAVNENYGLHFTMGYAHVFSPKVTGETESFSATVALDDAQLRQCFFGVGVTAWFSDNMYFTTSFGPTNIGIKYDSIDYEDDAWGIGGELLVGKEWFLGKAVGLGAAVGGTWHVVPAGGGNLTDVDSLRGFTAGARLSLTFN